MKSIAACLLSLVVATGCKKSESDCEAVFNHTVSLVPAEMQAEIKKGKAEAMAKCEKLPAESRKCVLAAKSMEDLLKCPRT